MTAPKQRLDIDAHTIVRHQQELVARWHEQDIDNPYTGFLQLVCQQHEFNFRLWHEEDIARSPTASDTEIAQVKRNIDGLNQKRNDMIERLDDAITERLQSEGVVVAAEAPINTETAGSTIDRLSIMSLRLYHYEEQLHRGDADQAHKAKVTQRIEICRLQHSDLTDALATLLDDLFAGRKLHKTYRQFKMYNDPSLNPSIYQASQRRAG
ncbi:DUF4254 domain-containing protein [Roseimaritima sediminicola]|uniref:DUF4254 domain-containing protein n=1 Tax=Roseimaritima sediminicola TaxID=2662066 RepID=UPI0012982A64|nr:DUF4254 domain-containing protein [Roseimaritima sediminicola]